MTRRSDLLERVVAVEDRDLDDVLWSTTQVARFLGVSEEAIRVRRLKGGFPKPLVFSRRNTRFRRSEIIAWAEKHRVTD